MHNYMTIQKPIVAMIYDFDGTLAPGNMQEYDFLKEIGVTDKAEFWRENDALGKAQNATEVLSYMKLMIDKSNNPNHPRPITRQTFKQYGASIPLFKGVKEWFALTRKLGEEMGLQIEHYGSIIVNPKARIGRNCKIHGNCCIGSTGGYPDDSPVIGDHVDIGQGGQILGGIRIADNVKIGAGAVVVKDVLTPGVTVVGVPGKVIEKDV